MRLAAFKSRLLKDRALIVLLRNNALRLAAAERVVEKARELVTAKAAYMQSLGEAEEDALHIARTTAALGLVELELDKALSDHARLADGGDAGVSRSAGGPPMSKHPMAEELPPAMVEACVKSVVRQRLNNWFTTSDKNRAACCEDGARLLAAAAVWTPPADPPKAEPARSDRSEQTKALEAAMHDLHDDQSGPGELAKKIMAHDLKLSRRLDALESARTPEARHGLAPTPPPP